ncbi:hypothetical protein PC9H_009452 [Pleurotus ostreatus]|uniref:Uncharacterized protein n=1 Tax=Pleurotus ostreatus TaxID=5322 RepID=A0A8H7DMY7_PLEOS|nr:uncharacterized protein PC9H_009452 [Pleurotus ostreatus]KAF7424149.1 hypothetical protein PC9H_009452 [Pleurotus ostreatus]
MVFSTPSILSLVGVAFWLWIKNRRPDATTLPALQVGLLLVIYSDFRDSACGTVSPNGRRDTWSSGQMVYLHGLDGTTILFLNNVKLVLKPYALMHARSRLEASAQVSAEWYES